MKIKTVTSKEHDTRAMEISYGFCPTPFGEGVVAWCPEGICFVGFVTEGKAKALKELDYRWKGAALREDNEGAKALAEEIFSRDRQKGLTLLLKGTPFQIEVWKALLEIPFGRTTSYTDVAAKAGKPSAIRAAASAVGRNDLSFIVPCHRVLRSDGSPGGYYWGLPLKKRILDWESKA